jgi:hypothetical protein
MEKELLTIAIAALLKRSRNAIQFTDAEIEAARADIANGARVLATTTCQFGEGRRTTYRIDLVREGV